MYMSDIKLFIKNEKELETLTQAAKIYCQYIRMEFSREKCAIPIMKNGKKTHDERNGTTKQGKIRILWEKTYKYLGIFEEDDIKQVEMKEKIKKEYLRRIRKLPKTKLYSRNLIKGINTWVVHLVRYSGPFLKWTREEQMDQRIRKLMTIHEALHSRDDVEWLYMSRKTGRRELASIEDSVDASTQWLEDYKEKRRERPITATRNNIDNTRINRTKVTRKPKWEEKQLYGRFNRQANDISREKNWMWLRKGKLKRETEYLLIGAQNNAIRTNYIRERIDETQQIS